MQPDTSVTRRQGNSRQFNLNEGLCVGSAWYSYLYDHEIHEHGLFAWSDRISFDEVCWFFRWGVRGLSGRIFAVVLLVERFRACFDRPESDSLFSLGRLFALNFMKGYLAWELYWITGSSCRLFVVSHSRLLLGLFVRWFWLWSRACSGQVEWWGEWYARAAQTLRKRDELWSSCGPNVFDGVRKVVLMGNLWTAICLWIVWN